MPAYFDLRFQLPKAFVKPLASTHHSFFTADHGSSRSFVTRNKAGGEVASTHIFEQRVADVILDFGFQIREMIAKHFYYVYRNEWSILAECNTEASCLMR
jgi:hypothetical protein